MSSIDRLAELQRQRALAQAQVDWFDREIAREEGAPGVNPLSPIEIDTGRVRVSAAASQVSISSQASASATQAPAPHDADALIARFIQSPGSSAAEVKRGCLLYAGIAMGTLILLTLAAYFFYTRGR